MCLFSLYIEKCIWDNVDPTHQCIPKYKEIKEANDHYCVGWKPYDPTSINCASPYLYSQESWKYKKWSEIWGVAIGGVYTLYGGGGYVLKLDTSIGNARNILTELRDYKWINRETRAVFIEFTLYNANINLFAYCVFLTEFTEIGGLMTWSDIHTFRAYQQTGGLGTYSMVCYAIYVVVLIGTMISLSLKLKKMGWKFLEDAWNWVDTTCCLLSLVGVVMFTLRYIYSAKSLQIYYDSLDKKDFINFQHVVVWDIVFNTILATLVFIATIRILRVLGYNKRMTQLADVITNAATEMFGFGMVFGVVFFAYMSMGYLLFGIHLYEYRDLFASFGTLANGLIGKNSLNDMLRAVPNIAQFYYFTYCLFVLFILMTVFAVVLNHSIHEVKNDMVETSETFGITNILGKSLKGILGMAFKTKENEKTEGKIATANKSKFRTYLII